MHIMSTKLGLGVNTPNDRDSIKMIPNCEVEKKVKHVRKKLTYLKGHLLTSNEFNRCGTSHAGWEDCMRGIMFLNNLFMFTIYLYSLHIHRMIVLWIVYFMCMTPHANPKM